MINHNVSSALTLSKQLTEMRQFIVLTIAMYKTPYNL